MPEKVDSRAEILKIALTSTNPIKELMKAVVLSIKEGVTDNLREIDVALMDRFIEFLRSGARDDLNLFLHSILAFIDSKDGDKLKSLKGGKRYFFRWEHFHDLCNLSIENFNPLLVERFIASRKRGQDMMNVLYNNPEGLRHKELAKHLGISEQNLAKLLREFEHQSLIARERKDKVTMVRLSFAGRSFMAEKTSPQEPERMEAAESKHSGPPVPCVDSAMQVPATSEIDLRIHRLVDNSPKPRQLIMAN